MDRRTVLKRVGIPLGAIPVLGLVSTRSQRLPLWDRQTTYSTTRQVAYAGAEWESIRRTRGDAPAEGPCSPWTPIRFVERKRNPASEQMNSDPPPQPTSTPVERHGQLQVLERTLCNAAGHPVQLRGMSTHGIQWFGWGDFLSEASLDALATDWNADLCRIALYVHEGGYKTDPAGFLAEVNQLIEALTSRGLYVIIDFHVLDPGNPLEVLDLATEFFENIASQHADKPNLIYEICNEPNNVEWGPIKAYAEQVIPVIRTHDPDSPIVVGTRGWSSLGFSDIGADGPTEIQQNPVSGTNILYAYHFYAASHGHRERRWLASAAESLPLFVTECGTMRADGDGPNDFESAAAFFELLSRWGISWAAWNYSDDWRTSGVWKAGTADRQRWTADELTETGQWIRGRIRSGC